MPLFRAAGELISDPEGVRFPMKDEAAGKDIPCLVTFEFLQARSGIGAVDAQEMIEEFEIYRAEIEEFASRKYDLGDSQPRITKADSLLD